MNTKRKAELMDMLCSCNGICSSTKYFEELQSSGQRLKNNEDFLNIANFGTAISSIERLIILNSLKEKDRCVCELEAILNKSQSTISHHLRKLERANLILSWKKGNYTYYGLKREEMKLFLKILDKVFNSAQ
ncbi:MAG: ArsR family transcriptional regulator [Promethearchaeota archaeon]|nr:MAG: ArsR family transcriptional regulator [Candidatus Lokiarchaeota archaeon]